MAALVSLLHAGFEGASLYYAWGAENEEILGGMAGLVFGGIGDALAQRAERREEKNSPGGVQHHHDVTRTLIVGSYCATMAIIFWHPLFLWMDQSFGEAGMKSVLCKVLVDNLLALPLVDVPGFYVFTIAPRLGLVNALERLREDYRNIVVAGWMLWIPASMFVFAFCPSHLRVPFIFLVDTFLAADLSFRSNNKEPAEKKPREH
jgi:protein Mpv17